MRHRCRSTSTTVSAEGGAACKPWKPRSRSGDHHHKPPLPLSPPPLPQKKRRQRRWQLREPAKALLSENKLSSKWHVVNSLVFLTSAPAAAEAADEDVAPPATKAPSTERRATASKTSASASPAAPARALKGGSTTTCRPPHCRTSAGAGLERWRHGRAGHNRAAGAASAAAAADPSLPRSSGTAAGPPSPTSGLLSCCCICSSGQRCSNRTAARCQGSCVRGGAAPSASLPRPVAPAPTAGPGGWLWHARESSEADPVRSCL
mmetsp:Transcript_95405/g.309148  ORF Transcript_95405/g.309148 Transcript_95405/m.309148 type:complete len:263 (-) Transcript_95405:49-837(-)